MSAAQVGEPVLLTWDEYVKFETVYEGRRHELVHGRVHLMAGGSERHDILVPTHDGRSVRSPSGELWLGPGSLKVPELWDQTDARVTSG